MDLRLKLMENFSDFRSQLICTIKPTISKCDYLEYEYINYKCDNEIVEYTIGGMPIIRIPHKSEEIFVILNEFTVELMPTLLSLLEPFSFNLIIDGCIESLTTTIYCKSCIVDDDGSQYSSPYDYCIVSLFSIDVEYERLIRPIIARNRYSLDVAISVKYPFAIDVVALLEDWELSIAKLISIIKGNKYIIGMNCSNVYITELKEVLPNLEYIGKDLDKFMKDSYIEHDMYRPLIKSARN